ncbi:PREDICTED: uncharacterized protein LOC108770795 [Trachymyrmex cornetzi]|uniref:uncharacterized protein LOC108770795 n=1 Tax=Trachymyrmex cornetzi TaxID=471704 RepID=UPI00084F836F|nr:PREDICTED: uncharacterized protein LOC108770795 [Trachymyrmex cornetzi]
MHKLGHCGGDARLMEIISHHLEVRECLNHEDDVGGYIADFKRRVIPHRGRHPSGRLSSRRRRPAEQAINEVVPTRRTRIEAVWDYPRNERNFPMVILNEFFKYFFLQDQFL